MTEAVGKRESWLAANCYHVLRPELRILVKKSTVLGPQSKRVCKMDLNTESRNSFGPVLRDTAEVRAKKRGARWPYHPDLEAKGSRGRTAIFAAAKGT